MDNIEKFVRDFEKTGLYPEFRPIEEGVNEPICKIGGKEYLLFCANNYLGLSQHKDVKEAGKRAIDKYGMGPGGSRVISGDVDIINELEKRIAKLVGAEDCITYPTGYMANVSLFRAIMDPMFFNKPVKSEDSVIFSDESNHGSIVDGVRLSKARRVIFKHDDLEDLEQKIKENNLPNKLIVTEGVFSLDGEIINIPEYIALAKKYKAKLMVDDAHGVGILGENGGGVGELLDCAGDIDIIMGCMDKAFGGTGGYLCGSKALIKHLRIATRSSILSSALTTSMAGAMIESINQMENGQELRKTLFKKADYLRSRLIDAGFTIVGRDLLPAIALYVGDEKKGIKFSDMLWERGVHLPVVRWPAVPQGQSRFRIIVMVNHTDEQLDRFADACIEVGRKLKLIR